MTTEPAVGRTARAASRDQVYESLPAFEKAAVWESKAPATAAEMLKRIAMDQRHRHRLAWAQFAKQVLGVVLGFGCVLVMAGVAWHYADLGQAVPGVAFAGTGTVATVAIFVTGKYLGRRR